ncbi:nucleotidyltransferase domain-containing protein [Bacillus salacetis]|uniref:Nucleotidyltransferase domain-containing protein n=1 Tax=Bacillus salacetis TaxID=2315464 RepID=A0A3A1R3W1_9BACI|nr:nucleotidyltransferase domain-containing protein [Bacillus salacetis]RIW37249.1 nucleotidyltransferase domain-containing protein [Bacillus salacetis]
MEKRILKELVEVEQAHNVEILYAVQAGSRAWGFPSPESDYDIRFIYRQPLDWYLSLEKKKDVIEKKAGGELELSGWDIKKALYLLKKSNPALLEWLHTEDRIMADQEFCQQIMRLKEQTFSPASCYYHYLKMSKSNWMKWKKKEGKSIKLTLHLLRGLLSCVWIQDNRSFPPITFRTLAEHTIEDPLVFEEAVKLTDLKKEGCVELSGRLLSLQVFINSEMDRLLKEPPLFQETPKVPFTSMNEVFRTIIKREKD